MGENIKSYIRSEKGKDNLLVVVIALGLLGSFGLGRLSNESSVHPIVIDYKEPSGSANALSAVDPLGFTLEASKTEALSSSKAIVASKRGSKYYFIWCSGAKSLSEANKIYFDTEESARAAGYEISTTCKK